MSLKIRFLIVPAALIGLGGAVCLAADKQAAKQPTPAAPPAAAKQNAPKAAGPAAPAPKAESPAPVGRTDNPALNQTPPPTRDAAERNENQAEGDSGPGNEDARDRDNARDQDSVRDRDDSRDRNSSNRGRDDDRTGRGRDSAQPNNGPTRHQTNRPVQANAGAVGRDGNARAQGRAANLGMNLGTGAGGALLISSVGGNGAFANVGLRPNDQIVSIGGQRFTSQAQLYGYLATVQAGQRIPFIVMRGGQQQTLYWTPSQQFVQQFADNGIADGTDFLGIHLDNQMQNGALVAAVEPNSPADAAGVQPNDKVVGVNGQEVSSAADFADATSRLAPNSAVDLAVSRISTLRLNPATPAAKPAPAQTQPVAAPATQPVQTQPAQTQPIQPTRRGLVPRLLGR